MANTTKFRKAGLVTFVLTTLAVSIFLLVISFHCIPFLVSPSATPSHARLPRVVKRSAPALHPFMYLRQCIPPNPSKTDISRLCRLNNCTVIQCLRSRDCSEHNPEVMTCFTKSCSMFTLQLVLNNKSELSFSNVTASLGNLSKYLNSSVFIESEIPGVESRIDRIICIERRSVFYGEEFYLSINNITQPCESARQTLPKFQNTNESSASFNIHVIYFRFLSRWESYFKFQNLHALMEQIRRNSPGNVYSSEKFQSQSFILEENLGAFLNLARSTHEDSAHVTNTLLDMAFLDGRCVKFAALSCHDSDIFQHIISHMLSARNVKNCNYSTVEVQSLTDEIKNTKNNSLCSDENSHLDNSFHIHDTLHRQLSDSNQQGNLFSITFINVLDIPAEIPLDESITQLLSRVLFHRSSHLFLLSDVGDPGFSRLVDSPFLRIQTFNPLLYVVNFHTPGLDVENILFSRRANESLQKDRPDELIRMSDVFDLARALMTSGERLELEKSNLTHAQIDTTGSGEDLPTEEPTRVSRHTKILKGYVENVCQGRRVASPNDTIQTAFALFVVGNLNNKLLELFSRRRNNSIKTLAQGTEPRVNERLIIPSYLPCRRVFGLKFDHVYRVLWHDTTYIWMSLQIQSIADRTVSNITLETVIEYTTLNSNMSIDIYFLLPRKIKLDSIFNTTTTNPHILLQHICKDPHSYAGNEDSETPFFNPLPLPVGHFGTESNITALHASCLFLVQTVFPESVGIETTNICMDRSYTLVLDAELVNAISMTSLPVELTLGPGEGKYVTSVVKSFYGVRGSGYVLAHSYKVFFT